jgi:glucans biosynthesis protein
MKNEKQPHGKWLLKNKNRPIDLRTLPRCHAKAKSTGQRCGNPAMSGKRVCYIHGGKSPGAPFGNQNALKFGLYTQEAKAERAHMHELISRANKIIKQLKDSEGAEDIADG